ncbi:MAG TPA: hypothetical protein DHW61_05445 [Lachnoclostridium phytofermentans]|uniref:Uncharacterized protein n=1 Tax=Lachnoclostridium phytofermentans TaxID=66219 RepID=A0A3D2X3W3_9FIRM|nr:hypothetical protein [Lachnoclostridium sp.]HCL01850.1 hypothetical protein [Lachnoclostridium phytofermentans]
MVENDLSSLIESRCDAILQKNKNYTELQEELANAHSSNDIDTFSEISYRMQFIAVTTAYKLAVKDLHSIIYE